MILFVTTPQLPICFPANPSNRTLTNLGQALYSAASRKEAREMYSAITSPLAWLPRTSPVLSTELWSIAAGNANFDLPLLRPTVQVFSALLRGPCSRRSKLFIERLATNSPLYLICLSNMSSFRTPGNITLSLAYAVPPAGKRIKSRGLIIAGMTVQEQQPVSSWYPLFFLNCFQQQNSKRHLSAPPETQCILLLSCPFDLRSPESFDHERLKFTDASPLLPEEVGNRRTFVFSPTTFTGKKTILGTDFYSISKATTWLNR